MCLAQGPQRSETGEPWTWGLSVSSQALYHWATALPRAMKTKFLDHIYKVIELFNVPF